MITPAVVYKKVSPPNCLPVSAARLLSQPLAIPFTPKKLTYPRAITREGTHNGTMPAASKSLRPTKRLCEVKKAALTPITHAIRVENTAVYNVYRRMWIATLYSQGLYSIVLGTGAAAA